MFKIDNQRSSSTSLGLFLLYFHCEIIASLVYSSLAAFDKLARDLTLRRPSMSSLYYDPMFVWSKD